LEYQETGFDRVLADVPCSGSGTLSKKPDIKWKRALLDLHNVNRIQYQLICKASELVKPGGIVVYSTCSIEPEENFGIVKKFLDEHSDFVLLMQVKFFLPLLSMRTAVHKLFRMFILWTVLSPQN